jgi:serine/threonine protein phosphatase PrpC
MNIQYAFQKERGQSKVIQDHGFVWCHPEMKRYVFGVADGHGKEHGRFISNTLSEFMLSTIEENEAILTQENIVHFITHLFNGAQEFLVDSIINRLTTEKQCEVKVYENGEIFWRKASEQEWKILEGGCSVVTTFILQNLIFTATTGNCFATLMATEPILEYHDLANVHDVARPYVYTFIAGKNGKTRELNLSRDHSCTSFDEYTRFLKSPNRPKFMYDEFKDMPYKPIFTMVPSEGNYHKNKERDFASVLMIENSTKHFCMSSTRSFLDTNFIPFGVTHKPFITKVDLNDIWERDPTATLSLLVGTNGIFDNWIRTHEKAEQLQISPLFCLGEFLLHDSCLRALFENGQGASKILQEFMARNTIFAQSHFLDNYDDALGILVYLSKSETLPLTDFESSIIVHCKIEDPQELEEKEANKENIFENITEFDVTNASRFSF